VLQLKSREQKMNVLAIAGAAKRYTMNNNFQNYRQRASKQLRLPPKQRISLFRQLSVVVKRLSKGSCDPCL